MKGVDSLAMRAALWAIAVLTIGIIIFDLLASGGVSVSVLYIYIPPLLLTCFCPRIRHPIDFAVVATTLIRIDVFFKPSGIPIPNGVFNRMLGTLVQWGVALGSIHCKPVQEGLISDETI